jgi:hypothetical protein
MRQWLAAASAAVITLWGAGTPQATQIFDPFPSSCTSTNCSQIVIGGTVNAFNQTAGPWTAEIFAPTNGCLRLQGLTQNADLEITAVSPGGVVFRNDDSGLLPCPLCPLVKINGTQNGWYTVSVSHFAGSPVQENFTLSFGQYNVNNPNCSLPTIPVAAPAAAASKAGGSSPRASGGPGQ